jgi:hypothetical protein
MIKRGVVAVGIWLGNSGHVDLIFLLSGLGDDIVGQTAIAATTVIQEIILFAPYASMARKVAV